MPRILALSFPSFCRFAAVLGISRYNADWPTADHNCSVSPWLCSWTRRNQTNSFFSSARWLNLFQHVALERLVSPLPVSQPGLIRRPSGFRNGFVNIGAACRTKPSTFQSVASVIVHRPFLLRWRSAYSLALLVLTIQPISCLEPATK